MILISTENSFELWAMIVPKEYSVSIVKGLSERPGVFRADAPVVWVVPCWVGVYIGCLAIWRDARRSRRALQRRGEDDATEVRQFASTQRVVSCFLAVAIDEHHKSTVARSVARAHKFYRRSAMAGAER